MLVSIIRLFIVEYSNLECALLRLPQEKTSVAWQPWGSIRKACVVISKPPDTPEFIPASELRFRFYQSSLMLWATVFQKVMLSQSYPWIFEIIILLINKYFAYLSILILNPSKFMSNKNFFWHMLVLAVLSSNLHLRVKYHKLYACEVVTHEYVIPDFNFNLTPFQGFNRQTAKWVNTVFLFKAQNHEKNFAIWSIAIISKKNSVLSYLWFTSPPANNPVGSFVPVDGSPSNEETDAFAIIRRIRTVTGDSTLSLIADRTLRVTWLLYSHW